MPGARRMRYDRSTAIIKRHQELLSLIRQGTYSSPQLAKALGVSEQTIYRDILFLKRHGHRIRSVRLLASWAYKLNAPSTREHGSHAGTP